MVNSVIIATLAKLREYQTPPPSRYTSLDFIVCRGV
jgi:hypothetical protein